MAAEAGFDVKLVSSEFGAVINATMRREFGGVLGGWSGLLGPDRNSYPFLHSGQALNITKYANPHADELLEGARPESDPDRRRAWYERLWRREQVDLPLIYLWTTRKILGVSDSLASSDAVTMPAICTASPNRALPRRCRLDMDSTMIGILESTHDRHDDASGNAALTHGAGAEFAVTEGESRGIREIFHVPG